MHEVCPGGGGLVQVCAGKGQQPPPPAWTWGNGSAARPCRAFPAGAAAAPRPCSALAAAEIPAGIKPFLGRAGQQGQGRGWPCPPPWAGGYLQLPQQGQPLQRAPLHCPQAVGLEDSARETDMDSGTRGSPGAMELSGGSTLQQCHCSISPSPARAHHTHSRSRRLLPAC